jgi:hypothetical protein
VALRKCSKLWMYRCSVSIWDSWWDYMEFSDVATPKPRPTSTGRCVTFKLSKLHLGCFVVFSLFRPLESLLSESSLSRAT